MSKEYCCSIPVLIPSIQSLSNINLPSTFIPGQTFCQQDNLQVGQYVQFLKFTILSNNKINLKETVGKIIKISDEYADIEDYLGDVVSININYIKPIKEQISSNVKLQSAV